MSSRISTALMAFFEKYRVVFWYDAKKELRAEFEAVSLIDVVKLEINNNEYGLKYRILREEPNQKFLLYHEGPQPEDLQNWLLDVLLAYGEFRTDQVGIWLAEMELGQEFADVIQDHLEFFKQSKRREALKKRLKPTDTAKIIRLKMLAVCLATDARLEAILEALLQELAAGQDEKFKLLERCGLADFFWEQLAHKYSYKAQAPTLQDFAIELFKSSYNMELKGKAELSDDALIFLKSWKDNRNHKKSFTALSERYAQALGISRDLETRDYRDVLELDYFRLIDQKIISVLAEAVSSRTISHAEIDDYIRLRRQSIWFEEFRHLYEAIDYASQFLHKIENIRLEMTSSTEGVKLYCQSWYQIDQLYRRFTYHTRLSTQPTLMGKLEEQIENLYTNNFVLKLGNIFQDKISSLPEWKIPSIDRQNSFFNVHVRPFLEKGKKVCVIISDALRYEIGEELQRAIRQTDRYDADLRYMHSMLPSYTQLGMAALLPNKELAIANNESGTVLVDGQPSASTENRNKILQSMPKGRGQAISAETMLAMGKDEMRELSKAWDVLYIYHNRIDLAGDKRDSESTVFEAVNETIEELVRLIKRVANNNANNIIVTADHGFLYQNKSVEESDFADVNIQGDQVYCRSRRFVLGRALVEASGMSKYSSAQLGLAGDIEAQIPKSVNRLRLKGSGSRYVHGGASLQEIVIPVVKINKKRQSDTTFVSVEILGGSSSAITTGQLAVIMYQKEAVTDKMRPRTMRAGIYTEEGTLISNVVELIFDQTSDNPRDREQQAKFTLTSKADAYNGQEVLLKLEECVTGTSHYNEYASRRYIIRRSFTSDFD